jgi:hypothetical protein
MILKGATSPGAAQVQNMTRETTSKREENGSVALNNDLDDKQCKLKRIVKTCSRNDGNTRRKK